MIAGLRIGVRNHDECVCPRQLFRLGSFQHAELFSGSSQAWEALARLPEYLRRVLRPGINGDVADGAHIGHASGVNLGAGTKLANFKIVPGTIVVRPS